MATNFKLVMNANYWLASLPPTRRTAIGRYAKVVSYDMQGKQCYSTIPIKNQQVRISLTWTPSHLTAWTDSPVPFPLGKKGSGTLANCSLCGDEATLFFLASPVRSSFSADACTILQAIHWSQKLQLVCHFLLLLFTRPLPRDGGMAEDHGAPEAEQLPRVWTRGRREIVAKEWAAQSP